MEEEHMQTRSILTAIAAAAIVVTACGSG